MFQVRCIQKDELPALLELYQYLHDHDDPRPDADQIQAVWDTIWNNPWLYYFVGEIDGVLVSSCTLSIIPNLTRGMRPYGLIENVVTHPDHRRQGFGGQVLQYALQIAWDQNCYKVMLLTGRKEESTMVFYEKAGFVRGVKTGFIAYPD
jgi:GNAT superfamily N-acetyltransferase